MMIWRAAVTVSASCAATSSSRRTQEIAETGAWVARGCGYNPIPMNVLTDQQWIALLPRLRTTCPRLTAQDLDEAKGRIDLLTAKIQNRHWCSRTLAQQTVLKLLDETRVAATA